MGMVRLQSKHCPSLVETSLRLKVVSTVPDTFQKVFPPALLHCMRKFELGDVSDCHINCITQGIDVWKVHTLQLFLELANKKKSEGSRSGE